MSKCLYFIFVFKSFNVKIRSPLPYPYSVFHSITGDHDFHYQEYTLPASIQVTAFLAKSFWTIFFFFNYNKLTKFHLPKNALVKCCWQSETCKMLTDGRMPGKNDQNISFELSAYKMLL